LAEGLLRHMGGGEFEVVSAGTEATSVRPEAAAVMLEVGIDISGQHSKVLGPFVGQPFDDVITVCDQANDACPVFPGAVRRRHWSIEDPAKVGGAAEERLAAFRQARDELRERIAVELLSGWIAAGPATTHPLS
jgi:arsenate reductase